MAINFFFAIAICALRVVASPTGLSDEKPAIAHRAFPTNSQLWPEAKITWCYEDSDDEIDKDAAVDVIGSAWELWKKALGGKSSLQFVAADKGDPKCDRADESKLILHIIFNRNDENFASIGYGPKDSYIQYDYTHFETLYKDPNERAQARAAVLAHELGHTLGLEHEHQKPSAWAKVGGKLKLNCENVEGYQSLSDKGLNMDELCSDRKKALEAGFAAHNLLPLDASKGTDDGSFDWDSIMLYPSFFFAQEPGKFTMVKRDPDGGFIEPNFVPSARDAKAVINMYPN
ncbi:Uu.00g086970.m01.CDS01 [Anthostomella pinea]|uniref:Uu.00g086970.m01.CDS01 n=1 Tax=Anthostomella pinea TaxID=933095 RepID=A0AAI8VN68_9PEZI|nr:Uu.00g086970.m01.CDS01 [Anthostomella pinea]